MHEEKDRHNQGQGRSQFNEKKETWNEEECMQEKARKSVHHHTYDNDVDNKDSDIVDDDAQLHCNPSRFTERIGHQGAIGSSFTRPRVSQQRLDRILAENCSKQDSQES